MRHTHTGLKKGDPRSVRFPVGCPDPLTFSCIIPKIRRKLDFAVAFFMAHVCTTKGLAYLTPAAWADPMEKGHCALGIPEAPTLLASPHADAFWHLQPRTATVRALDAVPQKLPEGTLQKSELGWLQHVPKIRRELVFPHSNSQRPSRRVSMRVCCPVLLGSAAVSSAHCQPVQPLILHIQHVPSLIRFLLAASSGFPPTAKRRAEEHSPGIAISITTFTKKRVLLRKAVRHISCSQKEIPGGTCTALSLRRFFGARWALAWL